jgi:hypothetical protein
LEKIIDKINSIVFNGILPIAFIDSSVVELTKKFTVKLSPDKHKSHLKYGQLNLPDGHSSIMISKIYEIH